MAEKKECQVCGKEFVSLHSTIAISGYGKRESYSMCTECTKEIKHLVRKNMKSGDSSSTNGDSE